MLTPSIFVRMISMAAIVLLLLPQLNVAMLSRTTASAQELPDSLEERLAEVIGTAQQLPDRILEQLPELEVATFIDYKMSPSQAQHQGRSGDSCGDGSNRYATLAGGIKWRSYPVLYHIDTSAVRGISSSAAKSAVVAAFNEIDREEHPAGRFFAQASRPSDADISVRWGQLDGTGKSIAKTTFWYNADTRTLAYAEIILDRSERWSVISGLSCVGRAGSPFDIENVAIHEIGHAIGLGHVSDNRLTMYPSSAPGETLKRTLGNGDQIGIDRLY